jgi:hypothetical protein
MYEVENVARRGVRRERARVRARETRTRNACVCTLWRGACARAVRETGPGLDSSW